MGEKAVKKKKYIVEKAREVFCEKGYLEVTMNDIIAACEISRGGLYLYFDNLGDIFVEVLKLEAAESEDAFAPEITDSMSSAEILMLFLQEQKKELLKSEHSLTRAIYEYNFKNNIPAKDTHSPKKQFDIAVKVIEKLISGAVAEGDLNCSNPKGAARNIMYVVEGLRSTSLTMGITEEGVNREMKYLIDSLND